jgi:release factor glutamine methyltransferase
VFVAGTSGVGGLKLSVKKTKTIAEHLASAIEQLKNAQVAAAPREAKSLLAFALGANQTFLVAHSEYELSQAEEIHFQTILDRRVKREPFQYITGGQEFCGLDFVVSKDVLIPRPETELLVETAIGILPENGRFCEVGVGSGCISVTILHELKSTNAVALDISEKTLTIARLNAEKHQVNERLELRKSDVFENLNDGKFDLIVSNPPYISVEEMKTLQIEVRDYEPATALTDGADGLSIIEKIIGDAPRHLIENGFLLLEIGHLQSAEVKAMFDAAIWREVESLPDFRQIQRVIKARIN